MTVVVEDLSSGAKCGRVAGATLMRPDVGCAQRYADVRYVSERNKNLRKPAQCDHTSRWPTQRRAMCLPPARHLVHSGVETGVLEGFERVDTEIRQSKISLLAEKQTIKYVKVVHTRFSIAGEVTSCK